MRWNYLYIPVWDWISNFIPHFKGHLITYSCRDKKFIHVSKRGPGSHCQDYYFGTLASLPSYYDSFEDEAPIEMTLTLERQGTMTVIPVIATRVSDIPYYVKIESQAGKAPVATHNPLPQHLLVLSNTIRACLARFQRIKYNMLADYVRCNKVTK